MLNSGSIKISKKFLRNIWDVFNCEINVDLNWSKKCVKIANSAADQGATFPITDTKLYVSFVTLST